MRTRVNLFVSMCLVNVSDFCVAELLCRPEAGYHDGFARFNPYHHKIIDRKILSFPVQLTTSRIDNLTLLILTLSICDDPICYTYIHNPLDCATRPR